jgi:hypothetical protein
MRALPRQTRRRFRIDRLSDVVLCRVFWGSVRQKGLPEIKAIARRRGGRVLNQLIEPFLRKQPTAMFAVITKAYCHWPSMRVGTSPRATSGRKRKVRLPLCKSDDVAYLMADWSVKELGEWPDRGVIRGLLDTSAESARASAIARRPDVIPAARRRALHAGKRSAALDQFSGRRGWRTSRQGHDLSALREQGSAVSRNWFAPCLARWPRPSTSCADTTCPSKPSSNASPTCSLLGSTEPDGATLCISSYPKVHSFRSWLNFTIAKSSSGA